MLSTRDAFDFYYMIEPYLPKENELDLFEFIGTIISNIKEDDPGVLVDILSKVTGKTNEEVLETIKPQEVLVILADFFAENKLLYMREFLKVIGNGRSK